MHADPEVMHDLGGPIGRAESDEKFDRYSMTFEKQGLSRWAVEDRDATFLGYAGVMFQPSPTHPLGPHFDIGWRFRRRAWGRGYATESAKAALADAFRSAVLNEILSYTSPDNVRSQAVMARLGLRRDTSRDFVAGYERIGAWKGLVWVASRT